MGEALLYHDKQSKHLKRERVCPEDSAHVGAIGSALQPLVWWIRQLWVGRRPGKARLWMGVGAIGAFGSLSGSVSSDEIQGSIVACRTHADGPCRPGIPISTGGESGSSVKEAIQLCMKMKLVIWRGLGPLY